MTMTSSRRLSRAFTLIELLVVITIIGLLAGLAFPAIGAALTAAKKAEAAAMINQLKVALTAYQTEYGVWPAVFPDNDGEVDSSDPDLYETLIAKKTSGNSFPADNPRGIVFMEFNTKVLRSGTPSKTNGKLVGTADKFVDPWNQVYRLKADTDYDNEIALPAPFGTINASLAIWSRGPQKNYDGELTPDKTYIRSW